MRTLLGYRSPQDPKRLFFDHMVNHLDRRNRNEKNDVNFNLIHFIHGFSILRANLKTSKTVLALRGLVFFTNYGIFTIRLCLDKSPATTYNFEKYVYLKFYDNTLFHRIIINKIIQGGGYAVQDPKAYFNSSLEKGGTLPAIDNEVSTSHLKNLRGWDFYGENS